MKKIGGIEYKMSKQHFDALLKARSGEEKNMNPYEYIIKVLNSEYGLKGTVAHIIIG